MKTAGSLLYKPVRIHPQKYEGKECLIAQTSVIKKDKRVENVLLATELYKTVDTIKESMKNNVNLPYDTKIIRGRKGNFKLASLSNLNQNHYQILQNREKHHSTTLIMKLKINKYGKRQYFRKQNFS